MVSRSEPTSGVLDLVGHLGRFVVGEQTRQLFEHSLVVLASEAQDHFGEALVWSFALAKRLVGVGRERDGVGSHDHISIHQSDGSTHR